MVISCQFPFVLSYLYYWNPSVQHNILNTVFGDMAETLQSSTASSNGDETTSSSFNTKKDVGKSKPDEQAQSFNPVSKTLDDTYLDRIFDDSKWISSIFQKASNSQEELIPPQRQFRTYNPLSTTFYNNSFLNQSFLAAWLFNTIPQHSYTLPLRIPATFHPRNYNYLIILVILLIILLTARKMFRREGVKLPKHKMVHGA